MKKNNFKAKKGEGLVETLATLLLISVCIIGLIRFQSYLSYNNSLSQQQADATILAIKQIETVRDYQVLNNLSGYTSYQSIASGSGSSAGVNTSYTITWTVTANANPTYKTIDVTVSWTDINGTTQSTRLVSRVAGVDPANSSSVMSSLGGT